MADRILVQPDKPFIEEIMEMSGGTMKKCFQCATCSGVCPISPDIRPFPRKEMLWMQWGLKERLLADPDVWRCYQCGDCSAQCPRGAKPGDVLGAIRQYAFMHFSVPGFMGRALSSPLSLPGLLAVPVALFLYVLHVTGNLQTLPEGEIVFEKFVPHLYVDSIFIAVSALVILVLAAGLAKFWKAMAAGTPKGPEYGKVGLVGAFTGAVGEVLTHRQFKECGENKSRYLMHLTTFYGFIALFIVTAIVFFGLYLFDLKLPLPLTSPVKVLANAGAVLLIFGCTLAIYNRLAKDSRTGESFYYDWLFLLVLTIVGVSGLVTELSRLYEKPDVAYWSYFVHLVFIFFLIGYLPYSKFAHLIYRFVAIVFARYAGLPEPPRKKPVPGL
jgi:quinone-modifying oxidoreductase subunit QmoC